MSTKINFLGHTFKNPIIPASGTYGFGYEFSELYDINILGSIALKGTTLEPRYGNPLPRIAECPAGLVNAIGLQNPGVDNVVNVEIPEGLTYITNNPAYPDPNMSTSTGGIKLSYEGMGLQTAPFASSNSVFVTIHIAQLNENTKTGTNSNLFTFYGLPNDLW